MKSLGKKVKGIDKAIEEFNAWPATARIYADLQANRVWTETFVNPHEGRLKTLKPSVCEIHNKETLYGEDIKVSEETLLEKIEIEKEEFDCRRKMGSF